MTYEEAVNMKTYRNYCNCGGYAASMNGRNPESPHMQWCAQYKEFHERLTALKKGPSSGEAKNVD